MHENENIYKIQNALKIKSVVKNRNIIKILIAMAIK